jgi:Ca2+/Na+ antiporter
MAISDFFIDPTTLPQTFYGIVQLLTLLFLYGFIIFKASKMIADGSEMLMLVISPGILGGLLLPILGAFPDAMIVLMSGLGPIAEAQLQLNVGMGGLAGGSIMLLTLPWAGCILLGRVDFAQKKDGSIAAVGYKNKPKVTPRKTWIDAITMTGLQYSDEVRVNAVLMLITAIPYIISTFPIWINENSGKTSITQTCALIGFICASVCLFGYSGWQVFSATAQEYQQKRVIDARIHALNHKIMNLQALITIEEKEVMRNATGIDENSTEESLLPSHPVRTTSSDAHLRPTSSFFRKPRGRSPIMSASDTMMHKMFSKFDANGDGTIDREEFGVLVRDLGIPVQKGELKQMLRSIGGLDLQIEFKDFKEFINKYSKQIASNHSQSKSRINTNSLKVDNLSVIEEESNRGSETIDKMDIPVNEVVEDEDEDEEEDDEEEWEATEKTPFQIQVIAFSMLIVGMIVVAIISDPMVDVLSELANRFNISPFYTSFLITPIVTNASEVIASVIFSGRKTLASATLTYSALLGSTLMNNTMCLGIFLALVYFRGLDWVFSAEVTAIVAVQVIVGLSALKRIVPAWFSLLYASLFPLSLVFIYFLENYAGWK